MSTNSTLGERAWSLIEPYWLPLNELWDEGLAGFLERLRSVPSRVGHIYAANWCVSEVDNGGFLQFFWNTTGILAPEALAGFESMGATEPAGIVADAMRFFGAQYPREREARIQVLGGGVPDSRKGRLFEAEDDAFYRWFEAGENRWATLTDRYAEGA